MSKFAAIYKYTFEIFYRDMTAMLICMTFHQFVSHQKPFVRTTNLAYNKLL